MNMRRYINKSGLDLIKKSEGLRLTSYKCAAGILTVGWGSTGGHVKPGMTITAEQAEALLKSDLRRFEEAVAKLAPGSSDNQFSALVSFAFNVGIDALKTSTLLKLHRAGDYEGAAEQFKRWNKAGGKVLAGLVRRRAAEAALYRSKA